MATTSQLISMMKSHYPEVVAPLRLFANILLYLNGKDSKVLIIFRGCKKLKKKILSVESVDIHSSIPKKYVCVDFGPISGAPYHVYSANYNLLKLLSADIEADGILIHIYEEQFTCDMKTFFYTEGFDCDTNISIVLRMLNFYFDNVKLQNNKHKGQKLTEDSITKIRVRAVEHNKNTTKQALDDILSGVSLTKSERELIYGSS